MHRALPRRLRDREPSGIDQSQVTPDLHDGAPLRVPSNAGMVMLIEIRCVR